MTVACLASVWFCWAAAAAPASPPPAVAVSASVSNVLARVGDTIRYTVSVEHAPGVQVEFPDYPGSIAGFSVTQFGPLETREVNGRTRMSRWYDLRSFLAGAYAIPGPAVSYRPPGGSKALLRAADLFVRVESLVDAAAAGDLRDIQPPLAARPRYAKYYGWAAAGAAALLALGAAALWYEHRRRRGAPGPPPPPAHELAYAELEQLLQLDLIAAGKVKEFYYRLSDIVRHYIENRFGLMAPERTTEEFLAEMSAAPALSAAHKGLLAQFLEHCDLVKYAKYAPEESEIKAAYDAAVQFIDETRARGDAAAGEATP